MSISLALKASARSAYRDVWRASSALFFGDPAILQAFRFKMRNDATFAAEAATDPETYRRHNELAREVADVLRKNVVQAVKVSESQQGDDRTETWRIRLTKDTELGNNESIKNPPPIEKGSNRSARKREKGSPQTSGVDAARPVSSRISNSPKAPLPPFYSALKKAHQQRLIPELREEDLEETFVRGSGPGGQSINKTENNVQLLHKPTGLRVSCQDTRSLAQNRKLARRWLLEKLDKMENPGLSKEEMKAAKQRERERRRRKKAKKKATETQMSDNDQDN